ncbi:MAG: hypothetical protein NT177_07655 [Chloroflexi bacterium]|nr:hypothetical protein [Chloroflexota bacterium]
MEISEQPGGEPGYPLPQACKRERVIRKTNLSGVCALARHFMAVERARMRGKRPSNARLTALEREAMQWVERQKGQA